MKGNQLLEKLIPIFVRIGPSDKNLELYQEIQKNLINFDIVDSFNQLKKNNKGEGLALEIMMFNDKIIHDIVFTRSTVVYYTILIENIKSISIDSNFGENISENGDQNLIDNLQFTITHGDDLKLFYVTDTKKFIEFSRIKSELLKLITL